jgi:hypothetical protein
VASRADWRCEETVDLLGFLVILCVLLCGLRSGCAIKLGPGGVLRGLGIGFAGDEERVPAMGTSSSRRLRRRRDRQEIDGAYARWRLRFYVWGQLLAHVVLTVQLAEALLAWLEGRPPHLLAPFPRP